MCKAFWKTVIGKSWVHQQVLLWVWGSPQHPGVEVYVDPRS